MDRHILVIAQYFYPEQFRINDICIEWVKKGYRVTVITGIPNYPQGRYFEGYGLFKKRNETYNGVNIYRIPLIPRGNNRIGLSLNYISFVVSGYFWSMITKIKADVVFIYETSPMTQALPGVWYAKRLKIPCYLYVTDLWPESLTIAGVKNKLILKTIGKLVDYIYKYCHIIFTSSNSFIKVIHDRGVPKEKIKYWPQYAEDFYIPVNKETVLVPEIPLDGKINIIFAGNIGVAQGLDILPCTAQILKLKNVNVRFNIVGDGRFKGTLCKMVSNFNVNHMFNFIGKQPADRIPDFMAVCDAALICLSKHKVFSLTLPAKTQSCLSCGIPIIASADGEIQEIIKEANAGFCSNAGNAEMLASIIIDLLATSKKEMLQLAQNARRYYLLHFDKYKLLEMMDEYLSESYTMVMG